MQMKHLIIFALVGIALLLGFNIINGNRHENNRAVTVSADALADTDIVNLNTTDANIASGSNDINHQPLAEQPRAIMDKATTQIDSAQQIEKERLAQMESTQ